MPGGHAWSADGIEWSKISGSNCEFAQNGRFSLSRPHKAANGSVVNATYCTERPKLPAACGRSLADGPLQHRVRDWLAGKRKTQCRTQHMPKTDCRAQPLLPWPADGVFAGVALGLLSRALLLQLVRPKSS